MMLTRLLTLLPVALIACLPPMVVLNLPHFYEYVTYVGETVSQSLNLRLFLQFLVLVITATAWTLGAWYACMGRFAARGILPRALASPLDVWALITAYIVCLAPLIISFIVVSRCREIAGLLSKPQSSILFAGQLAIVGLAVFFVLSTVIGIVVRPRWILPTTKKELFRIQTALSTPAMVVMFLTYVGATEISQFCGLFTISFAALTIAVLALSAYTFSKLAVALSLCGLCVQLWIGEPVFTLRHNSDPQVADLVSEYRRWWKRPFGEGEGRVPPSIDPMLTGRGIDNFATAFPKWLESRPNLSSISARKERYPIFIIAAQGGGYQAAYQTSLFLAKLQDACPSFASHVFAISSVSGGTLGAVVFSSVLRATTSPVPAPADYAAREACGAAVIGSGPAEQIVKRFFNHDFLTPILAAGLFVDIPKYVIPLSYGRLDRAIAFEKALEAAWRNSAPAHARELFTAPFFTPPSDGGPLHAINLTSVDPGGLVILSQFYFSTGEEQHYTNILDYRPDLSISLSTAVSLSSRVPYLGPAGYLPPMVELTGEIGGGPTTLDAVQLVDGAYFDNSGLLTALQISQRVAEHLRETGKAELFEIIILQFRTESFGRGIQRNIVHDALVPIVALNKSRISHWVRAEVPLDRGAPGLFRDWGQAFGNFVVRSGEAPLTWVLSSITKRNIESYLNRLDGECPECGTGGDGALVGPLMIELRGGAGMNNAVARCILDVVSGRNARPVGCD